MIAVATPEPDAPATRALIAEGLEPLEFICRGEYDYGKSWHTLWNEGLPFCMIEWDVIPWPGAVQGLMECREPWCAHRYPLHPGQITCSYGIGAYQPKGKAPAEWRRTAWDRLDGSLQPVIRQRLARSPHVHEPPVAHARRNFQERDPREAHGV